MQDNKVIVNIKSGSKIRHVEALLNNAAKAVLETHGSDYCFESANSIVTYLEVDFSDRPDVVMLVVRPSAWIKAPYTLVGEEECQPEHLIKY